MINLSKQGLEILLKFVTPVFVAFVVLFGVMLEGILRIGQLNQSINLELAFWIWFAFCCLFLIFGGGIFITQSILLYNAELKLKLNQ